MAQKNEFEIYNDEGAFVRRVIVSRTGDDDWKEYLCLVSFGARSGILAPTDELLGFLDPDRKRLYGAVRLIRQYQLLGSPEDPAFRPNLCHILPLLLVDGAPTITLGSFGFTLRVATLDKDFSNFVFEGYLNVVDPGKVLLRP